MAAASKPDVDNLFRKIGEKLGWFKYGDLDSAIHSLSKSSKAKSAKSRLCLKKAVKQETDSSKNSNISEKSASTKKIQKAKLILDDSSSQGSNSDDDAHHLPKKSQTNSSSKNIHFSAKASTKKIQKARLTLDDSASDSSYSSDEAGLFSCKTKGDHKNDIVNTDLSNKVLHGKNEVGFSSPRHSKEKEKCSLVIESKLNGQMSEKITKMKLVDDSLKLSEEFIAPQKCKRKMGYRQQFTSDIENGWNNSQFELSPDLQDFGDPLKESTRIHRRSSVTYHRILNISGISSAGSSSMDGHEMSDSVFKSDDTHKQMPRGHCMEGKPVGCDYQKFVPSNGDIVRTLDNITLEEFHTVNETKDKQTGIQLQESIIQDTVNETKDKQTGIQLQESIIQETVHEKSKDLHFVTVEDSLLEEHTPLSCLRSSTHIIQSRSSSKLCLSGMQAIPDSESEGDDNKGNFLFREHINKHGRQLLFDKNNSMHEKSVNITGNNNSLSVSQDHKTPDKLLPEIGISVDNTCWGENASWYEVADVSIQCNILCKSSNTIENFKGIENCHASSQLNESHIGDDNVGNNTNSPKDNSVDVANVDVNDEDESIYEVVDVSIQTDNPTVIDKSYYHERESDDDDSSVKLLNNNSTTINSGNDSNRSAILLETGLSSDISAMSLDSPSMFCTFIGTPDKKLKQTSSLNITKKPQNVLQTITTSNQLQKDRHQNYKRKKTQADETIYFDAVSDNDQVELPSIEDGLQEDGLDLEDVERKKISYDWSEEGDLDLEDRERKKIGDRTEEDGSDLEDGERKKISYDWSEEGDSDLEDRERKKIDDRTEEDGLDLEDGERKKISYDWLEEGDSDLEDRERKKIDDRTEEDGSDLEDGVRKKINYDGTEEGDSDLEDRERKKIDDRTEENGLDLEDGEREKIDTNRAEEGESDFEDGKRKKIDIDVLEENSSALKKNSCRGVVIQPSTDENKNNWRARRDYDSESSDDGLEAFFQKMRTPLQSKGGNSGRKKSRNSLKNFIVDDDEEISSMSDEEDELFYISVNRALDTPLTERIKSKKTSYPSTTFDGSDGDFSSSVYPKSVTKHKRENVTKASKSTTRQKKTNFSSSSNDSSLDTDDSKHPKSTVKSNFNSSDIEYSDENFTEDSFNKLKENNTAESNSSSIPDAVLKSRVINTFVTPKSKVPKSAGVNNFKTPSLLTPKAASCKDLTAKKTSAAGGTLNFLQSLSNDADDYMRHSDAVRFITAFKKYKEELSSKLLRLFNETVFDGQLPSDLPVIWNKRLLRTAGYCAYKYSASNSEAKRSARIELSTKVCDSAERVRDTLIHEMCHAAVWLLNGAKDGHGPYWKYWAKKANMAHPEIPVVARCHNYSISTKYIYRCTKCGYSVGRHSKSLDTEKKVCGYCHGNFELLSNKSTTSTPSVSGGTPAPQKISSKNEEEIITKRHKSLLMGSSKCSPAHQKYKPDFSISTD
ncbi:hypothetical protein ACJMK2_032393 [Sinanodonta woodiana]|uniref:SprT-like domain-containing protein n=1 Tax=Sinanodonta woodiana TaxID=1069815 RepID=A0ABD3X306_SINWO